MFRVVQVRDPFRIVGSSYHIALFLCRFSQSPKPLRSLLCDFLTPTAIFFFSCFFSLLFVPALCFLLWPLPLRLVPGCLDLFNASTALYDPPFCVCPPTCGDSGLRLLPVNLDWYFEVSRGQVEFPATRAPPTKSGFTVPQATREIVPKVPFYRPSS